MTLDPDSKPHPENPDKMASLLSSIFNAFPAHIAIIDHTGKVLLVNATWREFAADNCLHGPAFSVKRNYLDISEQAQGAAAADAHRAAQGIRQVLAGEVPEFTMDYRSDSKESPRWFRLLAVPLLHMQRTGAILLHTEITGQRLAEERIRASEASMAAAQEIAHTGSWEVALTGETFGDEEQHLWSDETFRIYGYEPGAIKPGPQAIFSRIHPEDHELLRHVIIKAVNECTGYSIFHRILLPNGETRYVHRRAKVVTDEQTGRPVKLIGTLHDITERRLVEERLREQASLLNQTTDAIIVRDIDDTIRFWSRGAERMYGWGADEAVNHKITELIVKDTVSYSQACQDLHQNWHWNGEQRHRTKAGEEIIVESRWTILPDDIGQPKSILAISTDITGRKRLEAQFLRAQRLESIGKLASGIAHDLNNVLTPILISIGLLRDKVEGEDLETLRNIEASAKRGADIIRQLLFFGRGSQSDHEPVHPAAFLREIEGILRETFPKNIQSEVTFDPNLWLITGNHTQLHQVLLNLCVNARDAMPNGGRLRISAQNIYLDDNYAQMNPDCHKGPNVMIQVSDTGCGIPNDLREKVFEPFFTTKETGKGTGLGLSTSLAIVKGHHGIINLYSEPGKGTTFKIYLPAAKVPASEVWQTQTAEYPRGTGQTILLVDDEKAVLNIAQKTLERFGYKVLTADDGASAVALYAQNRKKIAVVITDMIMPVMDGRACIHALLQINPDVKIIAASGLGPDSGYIKAVESGVKHFLSKPFTAEAVLKKLHDLIHGKPE
jgi:PAS domain S-box-containing protein